MKNKLPEVGKRYRNREDYYIIRITDIQETHYRAIFIYYVLEQTENILDDRRSYLDEFWTLYEELPEDNSNQSEVERVKEELKKEIRSEYNAWGSLTELGQAAQNLLNALDAQKESNNHQISKDAPAKACTDSGCNDNDKLSNKDSIWKDIKGKLYNTEHSSSDITGAIELIIKQQEQNTKRLDKLEQLIK